MERVEQEIGTEWAPPPTPGDHEMPLGERIKALRTEAGLSQAELAEQVGGDGRQISRYENGRITPSLDALARLAETLNISLDYLVFDDIARRPLHAPENILGERLHALAELDDNDRASLLNVIDALVTKHRVRTLATDVS
jgi:transcriptional regulator with XRE-family HTH domain